MQRLRSHVIALEKAGVVVEEKLTASDRLARCSRSLILSSRGRSKSAGTRVDRSVLVDTILRLAGELRQQLGLQLSISRALIDLRVVRDFQITVIDAIREESPHTAQRIVTRLKERRAASWC
jgi:hypothetical protein